MRNFAWAFVAAAALLIWAPQAFAEQSMTMKQTAEPVQTTYPGLSLDILGIKPGMSVDATKAVLASFYGTAPNVNTITWSGGYNGIQMTAQPTVRTMSGVKSTNDITDSTNVTFGAPSTGTTVVSVYRQIAFNTAKSQPTLDQTFAALEKKYGKESQPRTKADTYAVTASWVFGKSGHLLNTCPGLGNSSNRQCYCPTDFDAGNVKPFEFLLAQNKYLCILTVMSVSTEDTNRVTGITIAIASPIDMLISAKAAIQQFQAAAIAASKSEKPAKLPKF